MDPDYKRIEFRVNGQDVTLDVEPQELLLDLLRERLNLTGSKRSCDLQVCGACTVLLDGRAISSCSYLAVRVAGKSVLTIEGLAQGDTLHPLQERFLEKGAFQCGYCTPGMILTAKALLEDNPRPTREEITAYLRGNICRCTGYLPIIDAILSVAEEARVAEPISVSRRSTDASRH